MRIVILGAGSVGIHIARELIEEKRDVVIIEKDPELARIADNELDCLVLNEDGSRPETLRMAQTATADWFIALTGSDAVNIVACGLVAAETSRTKTIARVETPFYSALSEVQRRTFGLDHLVNPAMEASRTLTRIIAEGFAEHVIPLHEGALQLRMIVAGAGNDFAGKTMKELRERSDKHFLVTAIIREGTLLVPKGDTRLNEGERFYILGQPDSLDTLFGKVEGLQDHARKIVILGATRIAERLVECLLEGQRTDSNLRSFFGSLVNGKLFRRKLDITLIDLSEEECRRIGKVFPDIDVVCGDSGDEGFLESVGVKTADLFVGATDSQTKNIITAQLAKVLGARKSMAFTLNHRFLPLGPGLDVDSYVCANDAVVSTVLATVRKAHIRTIHAFYEDTVEIVELAIDPASPVLGKALRDLVLPKDVLVAFIQQMNRFIVPSGDTALSGGDIIGLVAPKRAIAALELIFGGA